MFKVIEDRGCNIRYTVEEGLSYNEAVKAVEEYTEIAKNYDLVNGNGDLFTYIIEAE